MRFKNIKEGVGRITKQNQTVDVGPKEITKQAAKFGNKVDKDGRPPTLSKKVKGSSTNVLFNLGLAESIKSKTVDNYKSFIGFCCKELGAKTPPNIRLTARELPETFGYYDIDENAITVSYARRHQMDVMRTIAHEIVHHVQRENKEDLDGADGSIDENEANARAGVVLRKWASKKPHLFSESVDNLYESVLYYRQMKENLGEIAQSTEIYVDMDGVLADFFGEWAKLMNVDHFTKIDKEHKIGDALQKIRDTDEFWLNLPLLPQAKQLLAVIKQIKGSYNICSSPLADDPNSEPHKRQWIEKNLSFFPPKKVIITNDKPQYATQQDGTPNILIDDFGKNVDAWEAAGGTAFKYKDHKFERTAKAIQKHMGEPVTEQSKAGELANKKAIPYDFPIKKEIADLIITAYPDIKKIWLYNEKFGILGFKTTDGPMVRRIQRQMQKDGYPIDDDGVMGAKTQKMFNHWIGNVVTYIKHDYLDEPVNEISTIEENFADGKKKGKSRPGRVKRSGASCKGSVTSLRKKAKKASGERAKMYHWCANMKGGRKKKRKKS